MTATDVRASFSAAMWSIYRRAKKEVGYDAHVYVQMLERHGGYETARRLIHDANVQYGFTRLWEAGRLDLTAEAHVVQQRFDDLFTDEERGLCEDRLRRYQVTDDELEGFRRR